MQLEELVGDLEKEELLIIKDYMTSKKRKTAEKYLEDISNLDYDALMQQQIIAKILQSLREKKWEIFVNLSKNWWKQILKLFDNNN